MRWRFPLTHFKTQLKEILEIAIVRTDQGKHEPPKLLQAIAAHSQDENENPQLHEGRKLINAFCLADVFYINCSKT